MIKLIDITKEQPDKDLSKEFNSTEVDLTKEVKRPPIAISIGRDDRSYRGEFYPLKFGSFGNFSVITGEKGSRKSFVKSLLEACSVGGNSNNYTDTLEIVGHFKDKWIISIDAEQSEFDAWSNGIRIPTMVGSHHPKYKLFMWREKSREERRQLLDWLFMSSPFKDNLGLVFIDGYVDFVNDPNDQTECNTFIDLIMKYSSVTNCHISGVLHVNPGSEKMRGHLGTIAGQKTEMEMLVKNMGQYSLVTCKKIRGGKPFNDFTIRINDDWMPYVSNDVEKILI